MYNMFYRLMFRVYCKWCEDQRWSAMLISWSTNTAYLCMEEFISYITPC